MILRRIFGREWESLNEAFYSKPKKGLVRGSYWCWLLQGDGNAPKVWVMVSHIAVKHTINGVENYATDTEGKSFGTMMGCWYFDNGEVKDIFLDKSVTTVEKNRMVTETSDGYSLELSGNMEKYNLCLKKNGKPLLACRSRGADFSKVMPIFYHGSYNTKSFLDKKNKAYWLLSESVRIPQIVKYTNFFSYADVNFMGKKFKALSYTEKNHNIGPPMPWKYEIFDLKDGSRFRFFWSFRSPVKTPSDLDMTFDCAKTGKKYFFKDIKKLNFFYINKDCRRSQVFTPETKYVVINSTDDYGAKIELVAEVAGSHTYKYRVGLEINYEQILQKLKKIELTDQGNKIALDPAGSYGYGEYVDIA